jgi:uncharacterized protein involved in outer membrane biogenesis
MRKYRVPAAVFIVSMAAATAFVWQFDVDRHRGAIQAALTERVGRPVELGRLRLSLLPLGVRIEDFTLAEDPAFPSDRPFVQSDELRVGVRLWSLLGGRIEVRALEMQRPQLEFVRNAAGYWNVETLAGGGGRAMTIERLALRKGRVAVTDRRGAASRAVYENIDLEVSDYAAQQPFDLTLSATLPGTGAQRLTLDGRAGPVVGSRFLATPFDGEGAFDEVALSELLRFLQIQPLPGMEAVISGRARLTARNGEASAQGALRFEHPRARGIELGYPIAADFDLHHRTGSRVLRVKSADLLLDRTPLALSGLIDWQPGAAALDVQVKASEVPLAEAARMAAAFGIAFAADARADGRMTLDLHVHGLARRPEMEGRVSLRDISVSGAGLPGRVSTPSVDLAFTPREIRTSEFSASSNGTMLDARFVLADYATPVPTVDVVLRTTDAELADLLAVGRAWGMRAVEGLSGSGKVTADIRVTGRTSSLRYAGHAGVADVAVQLPALTQPLRVRHAEITYGGDGARAERLAASFAGTTASGTLQVRNFAEPQLAFDLSADDVDIVRMQAAIAGQPSKRADGHAFRRMTGTGRLRATRIAYAHLLLEDVDAMVALDRGLVRLEPLRAGLYGGRHRGTVTIDVRNVPAAIGMASDIERVDSDRLVTAVTSVEDVIHGALASAVRVNFAAGSGTHIARSLNGVFSLDIPKGRIPNLDLLNEIAGAARFVTGGESLAPATDVAAIGGHFKVLDGVARTDDLTATFEGGRVAVAGSADLATQALDLRVTAVLSRDYGRTIASTGIGGLMATVLANQQGELVVPMVLTGTMRQPRFAPDLERIAEMKVRNAVPTLRDPRTWTAGILGGALSPDGRQPGPEEMFEQLLGVMTGRAPRPKPGQGDAGKNAVPPAQPAQKDPDQQMQELLRELLRRGKKK